jgi:hypothetical protein
LKLHIATEHQKKKFKPTYKIFRKVFKPKGDLKLHFKEEQSESKPTTACDLCNEVFRNKTGNYIFALVSLPVHNYFDH